MNRIYCGDCRKFFVKIKTGFTISLEKTDGGRVVRGDMYQCDGCKRIVYGDFGEPFDISRIRGPFPDERRK